MNQKLIPNKSENNHTFLKGYAFKGLRKLS